MEKQKARSPELIALCARVAQWRQDSGGGRGTRVPEALWQEALRVVCIDGLYATAQATRLNYETLKDRLRQAPHNAGAAASDTQTRTTRSTRGSKKPRHAKRSGGAGPPAPPLPKGAADFVAVQMPAAPPNPGATIEFYGQNGERMRVLVQGPLNLVDLAQTFWRRAS